MAKPKGELVVDVGAWLRTDNCFDVRATLIWKSAGDMCREYSNQLTLNRIPYKTRAAARAFAESVVIKKER